MFLIFLGVVIFSFEKEEGHIFLNGINHKIFDFIAPYVTLVGDGLISLIVILLIFFYRIKYGIIALFAFIITSLITTVLKLYVFPDVQRPILEMWEYFHSEEAHKVIPIDEMKLSNSFPSGHTTSAMSLFCVLTLIFKKNILGILFGIIAISASYSRVYLSHHFAEDVFMGTIIGVAGTYLIFLLLEDKMSIRYGEDKITLKRVFDIISSIIILVIGFPFFILISLIILFTSKGSIFFIQNRVGLNNREFRLYKFRTMKKDSEKSGQITIGGKDSRITKVGYLLRKFKLDEFPQLINVIKGDMSIVGPRPEVRKYVDLYNEEQMNVLKVKPGLTGYASIEYIDENEILGNAIDPEKSYVEEIMPTKLQLNLKYIQEQSFWLDMKLVLRTIGKIFSLK